MSTTDELARCERLEAIMGRLMSFYHGHAKDRIEIEAEFYRNAADDIDWLLHEVSERNSGSLLDKLDREISSCREIISLLSRLESVEADTKRLDLAQKLLIGADFDWGDPEPPVAVVVFSLPRGIRVGTDFRTFLDNADAAMSKERE